MSDDALRVVVADDEPAARRGLRQILSEHGVKVVAEAADGPSTIDAVLENRPDALFLDVQMPGLTGLDVCDALVARRALMPHIVFVTAYDAFAIRAFEVSALDYLLKPISDERVRATIERCRDASRSRHDRDLRLRLEALMRQATPRQQLVIPEGARVTIVPESDVVWIEADDYYVTVHTTARSHLWRESLTALEGRLDPTAFVRVHRSAIVRIDQVREIRQGADGSAVLRLTTGHSVPISRGRRADVKARFGQLPRRS
jgi:two-component system LytT family response regulator